MKKKAIRKFKIAVGICGPTVLYSNVIKAQNPEEAVDRFIAESDGEYSATDKESLLGHVFEIESHKVKTENGNRSSMKDYILNEVKVGDQVAFICARRTEEGYRRYSIQKGIIQSFSDSSAVINCIDLGKSFRIIETSGNYTGNPIKQARLKKVALMKDYAETPDNMNPTDALGQELYVGDIVAYMDEIYQDSCAGFIRGTITKITAKFIEMDGAKKKTHEKVVKIQGCN